MNELCCRSDATSRGASSYRRQGSGLAQSQMKWYFARYDRELEAEAAMTEICESEPQFSRSKWLRRQQSRVLSLGGRIFVGFAREK